MKFCPRMFISSSLAYMVTIVRGSDATKRKFLRLSILYWRATSTSSRFTSPDRMVKLTVFPSLLDTWWRVIRLTLWM